MLVEELDVREVAGSERGGGRDPRGFRAAGVAGRGGLPRFLIAVPAALRRETA
ncbi:MAG: hypothetical protein OXU64_03185 [Gemmatimonadota bacterium]|nr:hypothetical protein [Gemmatimonadota bacterium]